MLTRNIIASALCYLYESDTALALSFKFYLHMLAFSFKWWLKRFSEWSKYISRITEAVAETPLHTLSSYFMKKKLFYIDLVPQENLLWYSTRSITPHTWFYTQISFSANQFAVHIQLKSLSYYSVVYHISYLSLSKMNSCRVYTAQNHRIIES